MIWGGDRGNIRNYFYLTRARLEPNVRSWKGGPRVTAAAAAIRWVCPYLKNHLARSQEYQR